MKVTSLDQVPVNVNVWVESEPARSPKQKMAWAELTKIDHTQTSSAILGFESADVKHIDCRTLSENINSIQNQGQNRVQSTITRSQIVFNHHRHHHRPQPLRATSKKVSLETNLNRKSLTLRNGSLAFLTFLLVSLSTYFLLT